MLPTYFYCGLTATLLDPTWIVAATAAGRPNMSMSIIIIIIIYRTSASQSRLNNVYFPLLVNPKCRSPQALVKRLLFAVSIRGALGL